MKTLKNFTTRSLLAGAALAAAFAFTVNAQAQTCTIANWDASAGSLVAGHPGDGNKRYGGPCSLRVTLDGDVAWVENQFQQGTDPAVPLDEPRHISRFYAFFGDITGSDEFVLYELYDDADVSLMTLTYNPSSGEITVDPMGGTAETFTTVAGRWHSIEVDWDVSSAGSEVVSVEIGTAAGVGSETISISSTTGHVASVRIGNVDGAISGGNLYIDDFDSRRLSSPGRLCRGDTSGNEEIRMADVNTVFREVQTFGAELAGGQPDFVENGIIAMADVNGMFARVQAFNFDCPTP